MLQPYGMASSGYPEATKTLASRSFVKELALSPELQGRNFKTTYSILDPGKPDSRSAFGVLGTPAPVIFSIHGGIPAPGTQVLAFYEGEQSSDSLRDGYANEAWVYDDLTILNKQILDGLHDSMLVHALESVYRQHSGSDAALAFMDIYTKNSYKLTPAHRQYAMAVLSQILRLGDGNDANTVYLTRVTLP
jgi:hypothetical protein